MRLSPPSPAVTRRHRPAVIAIMGLVHVALLVGLLNRDRVRDAVVEAAPVFLSVVSSPTPPTPARPLPPPPPRPAPKVLTVPLPLIAEPSPSASPLVTSTPPEAPPAPAARVTESPPAPVAAPAVKTFPASAVQYLVPPAPVYSRTSARMKEAGRAVVRVFIDEAGMPRSVEIATSSGFQRLDDAALVAVRQARFKPYAENGAAMSGWAFIPIEFTLEK